MGTIVSFNREFSAMGVRRAQDIRHGQAVMEIWEDDEYKLSFRAGTGWTLAVRLKPIGESAYSELASAVEEGLWTVVGVFQSRTAARETARGFQDGGKVWRESYRTNLGTVSAAILDSKYAHSELARGEAPRGSHA